MKHLNQKSVSVYYSMPIVARLALLNFSPNLKLVLNLYYLITSLLWHHTTHAYRFLIVPFYSTAVEKRSFIDRFLMAW